MQAIDLFFGIVGILIMIDNPRLLKTRKFQSDGNPITPCKLRHRDIKMD